MPSMPRSYPSASTPISDEEVEVTETNALNAQDFDEEYGVVHPGSKVKRYLKPVIHDSSAQSNCGKYCFIAFAMLAMCIILGSVWLVFEGMGYEDVYTYFIVPASAKVVAGSGSGFLDEEDCLEKLWYGRVCPAGSPAFPWMASNDHGPRRTIGCDMVAITPEPCNGHIWEVAHNHYITCDSYNTIQPGYDFCNTD